MLSPGRGAGDEQGSKGETVRELLEADRGRHGINSWLSKVRNEKRGKTTVVSRGHCREPRGRSGRPDASGFTESVNAKKSKFSIVGGRLTTGCCSLPVSSATRRPSGNMSSSIESRPSGGGI